MSVSRCVPAILLAACAIPPERSAEPRPNVIVILADDVGWTDLGCYGSRFYRTPNLDRFAREGLQFSAAYANAPNCAPSRACLLTGRLTPRHGVFTVSSAARGEAEFRRSEPVRNRVLLPLDEVTLAQSVRAAGYATAHFGKWQLGRDRGYRPSDRGFDESVVTFGPHHLAPHFGTLPHDDVAPGTDLGDYLTDRTLAFIERHRDRPFFVHLAHFAVHTPLQARPEVVARFAGAVPHGGHHDPTYAAMLDRLDQSLARILAQLVRLGIDDRTLVVFASDNGGVGGYPGSDGAVCHGLTDNAPLRGGKGMLYEGGLRVPLLARWPGRIHPAGLCTTPIQLSDLHATIRDLCGAAPTDGRPIDGRSLTAVIDGGEFEDRALYWHFPGYLQAEASTGTWRTTPAGAIRDGQFKLIEWFDDDRVELYDLLDDVGERRDLSTARPELAAELRARLTRWREAVDAPMPVSPTATR